MDYNQLIIITLAFPLTFAITALVSWFQPGLRPLILKRVAMTSALINILLAAFSGFFVAKYGLFETSLIGIENLGLSLRLDALSVTMLTMISLLAFIIIKFSLNYLDGDQRQGRFIGRLAATVASVQLLVLSGNLAILLIAWVLTSISLHRLLVFYSDRPGALIAARKKFIFARLGDLFLLGAVIVLYLGFGTGNLEMIFIAIQEGVSKEILNGNLEIAAIFLVAAAIFKSAQFPTHGWLIEVMETPTPVSALLHAGLLNAGPFLIIRMAFIMEASSYAQFILIGIGGFTALFASIAFITQTSVKTALGYSSIAHMGFSLMVCGFGVYSAAMLHLVAHSFYKAHAFLSSGSVIDVLRASKARSIKVKSSLWGLIMSIALALGIYAGFSKLWGIDFQKDLPLLAIGGVIVLGLTQLFASALASKGSIVLLLRASFMAIIVTAAFFTLESGTHSLLSGQLPETSFPSFIKTLSIVMVLLAFTSIVILQIMGPSLNSNRFYRAISIHFRNGFYANTIIDRMIGALEVKSPKKVDVLNQVEMSQRHRVVEEDLLHEHAI
jgi:NAD(P)H-quinone oxidoreductase subunit 5